MSAALQPIIVETASDLGAQYLKGLGLEEKLAHPLEALDERLMRILPPGAKAIGSFDDVKFHARIETGYPNPTLNHLFLAQHLRNARPHHLVDMGCGLGFLGNYASVHTDAKKITFADMNKNALQQCIDNYFLNHEELRDSTLKQTTVNETKYHNKKHTINLREGDVMVSMQRLQADTAVCAPMFIPGVCEVFPQAYMLFAHVSKGIGAKLLVGHSNLSSYKVAEAAEATQRNWRIVAEKEVPLYLEYFTGAKKEEEQIRHLQEPTRDALSRLGLVTKEIEGKRIHYHKLTISELG